MNWEQSACNCTAGPTCNPSGVHAVLAGPAGAEYARLWPELTNLQYPCVPCFNVIEHSTVVDVDQYVDITPTQAQQWHSSISVAQQ